MKKITLSVLMLASLSSTAFAEKSVALKAGSANIMQESVPMAFLSVGFTHTFSNNFYLGSIYNFGYGSMDQETTGATDTTQTIAVGEMDIDLRLGYTVGSLDMYGLIGAALQSIDTTSGAGLSFGGGADWRFAESFSVGVEYKQASMSLEGVVDYDYDLVSANIAYRW